MQAIETKFLPATNTRGARIKATCARGSITIPYPHELNREGSHIAAAKALAEKFAKEDLAERKIPIEENVWMRKRSVGILKNENYVHVLV